MSNKMLIDASHPEETRVIVTRGNKIEEFDFESEHKKQLKGNIYLARVTRVEPSLQAAFVEYGGNRHGFLAFSEIHPDYYQIPVADRLALLEAEAKAARAEDEDEEPKAKNDRSRRHRRRGRRDGQNGDSHSGGSNSGLPAAEPVGPAFENYVPGTPAIVLMKQAGHVISEAIDTDNGDDDDDNDVENEEDIVESVGSEDAMEELPSHGRTSRRQYNIQEVIKRRQIILVQVVKEERGNKGAALTTYLSLAGRYSVLMPNTARGGGISRKITNPQDRKRLKEIVKELEVPQGMGVILRTAGANRTKAEVKRDYEYLMRMWENVRTLTLQSTAPSLVYEEGSLIKRSIRDLYNKDITEILVSGETGYREAKDFMRMLMPSHAKVVQPYREQVPVFTRYGLEAQLDRMLLPQVTLKSGGYLIINQTEALVAIDVNSGRSTREHSIEDTALQTNLEAAEEVARQLRLRDLAGLIVVDFIDMEEKRNNRAVEKKMKDCLKDDRARIQVGRISHFGLLEMSRQRIRASVLESTMQVCQHCGGTGHIRSDSSMALHIIRGIEDYLLRHSGYDIVVRTPAASALYVLNHKRQLLADLEGRFGANISIDADESVGHQHFVIDKGAPSTRPVTIQPVQPMIYEDDIEDPEIPLEDDDAEEEIKAEAPAREESSEEGDRKRRRRRRRRGGRDRDNREQTEQVEAGSDDSDEDDEEDNASSSNASQSDEDRRKKRRRGRRGGRKNRREDDIQFNKVPDPEFVGYTPVIPAKVEKQPVDVVVAEAVAVETVTVEATEAAPAAETVADEKPAKPARKPRGRKTAKSEEAANDDVVVAEPAEEPAKPARKTRSRKKAVDEEVAAPAEDAEAAKPKRRTRKAAVKPEVEEVAVEPEVAPVAEAQKVTEPVVTSSDTEEQKPKRGGWWQKKGFF
ncbi:Rne/Rng family ribonuclease [Brucella pseudogrignonensis]|jgi:ribonuclease E|uniref:Rne/Rng family ribonuclease n=1 Tax=Brucella pseudogrignonensis TaxID=419475 RepID=UPI000CFAF370|nr:ribonuclease E/G [Brucella pseudogrignonensis]MQP38573.1 Rne/Rng family ribonuclease [Ochrobactrum sp. MYb237]KAB2691488.1 ribonuclease E/G [Brucella pseudogrignonensis]PQZ43201.1 ribonuclease E/G [Brucella pseudogrignonensis]PRA42948.1 ribonuclease E/G [Brucella pseudogrignonensis]PRA72583.1 ribonuclease E/G [Brucella pseudogrignonensis]